jgi:hypothetical protein
VTTPALISLASVKGWLQDAGLQPSPPTSDNLLNRLVGMASSFAVTYLSRPVAPATFSETYKGADTQALGLRQQPVILVRSLTIGTTVIPPRPSVGAFGFVNDSTSVYVDSCWRVFCRGVQNIAVTYDAGYQTADPVTVPAGTPAIPTDSLSRPWNADRGVAYATGAAFTLVTAAPTLAGTYQLTTDSLGNVTGYAFASADVGAAIVITYGFTPEDVAQALVELVGERYKSKNRIGTTSVGIQQQATAFSQRDMNAFAKATLAQWRNVVPIQ